MCRHHRAILPCRRPPATLTSASRRRHRPPRGTSPTAAATTLPTGRNPLRLLLLLRPHRRHGQALRRLRHQTRRPWIPHPSRMLRRRPRRLGGPHHQHPRPLSPRSRHRRRPPSRRLRERLRGRHRRRVGVSSAPTATSCHPPTRSHPATPTRTASAPRSGASWAARDARPKQQHSSPPPGSRTARW